MGKVFDDTYDLSWETIVADGIDTGDAGTSGSGYKVHNLRLTVAPRGAGVWRDTELRLGVENVFDEQFTPKPRLAPPARPQLQGDAGQDILTRPRDARRAQAVAWPTMLRCPVTHISGIVVFPPGSARCI
ncbi:hypothetical protein [Roseovarius sp. D22-M7]|uniref:hypothetical protein n=1 Tax=Roseovarius sp. D22-M7 TaxID=3127116 RepID=UPI00300FFC0E